jgi:hypothetical protein
MASNANRDSIVIDEKADANTAEHAVNPYRGLSQEDADFMWTYKGKPGKQVVRKVQSPITFASMQKCISNADFIAVQIDLRLIPIMGVLYLLAHIDRGNIGNAKIEGMDKDLGLVGNQYNIASTIFFVPYIIFGKTELIVGVGIHY